MHFIKNLNLCFRFIPPAYYREWIEGEWRNLPLHSFFSIHSCISSCKALKAPLSSKIKSGGNWQVVRCDKLEKLIEISIPNWSFDWKIDLVSFYFLLSFFLSFSLSLDTKDLLLVALLLSKIDGLYWLTVEIRTLWKFIAFKFLLFLKIFLLFLFTSNTLAYVTLI